MEVCGWMYEDRSMWMKVCGQSVRIEQLRMNHLNDDDHLAMQALRCSTQVCLIVMQFYCCVMSDDEGQMMGRYVSSCKRNCRRQWMTLDDSE